MATQFEAIQALDKLQTMLSPAGLVTLAQELEALRNDSGYGAITLVMTDRRINILKIDRSVKLGG
jgi:hypothetical protein